jgi:DNA repair ATPase RecN
MKRTIWLILAMPLLAGCGGENREELTKELIRTVETITDNVSKVNNAEDPAQEARKLKPELEQQQKDLRAIIQSLDRLAQEEEKTGERDAQVKKEKELRKRYGDKVESRLKFLDQAVEELKGHEQAWEILAPLFQEPQPEPAPKANGGDE